MYLLQNIKINHIREHFKNNLIIARARVHKTKFTRLNRKRKINYNFQFF